MITDTITLNDEKYYSELIVVRLLAMLYVTQPQTQVHIASLCDEGLDKSGRLLGLVRDAAIRLQKEMAA